MQHPIPEQLLVESAEQALALLHPLRAEIVSRLEQPASATEVGRSLGETPQRINYHIKALEKVGLVCRAGSRQVRNLVEVLYQAAARTFVISDALAPVIGSRRKLPEQGALASLVHTADQLRRDALELMEHTEAGEEVPSAVLTSSIRLKDEGKRQAFLAEYMAAVENVMKKYALPEDEVGVGEEYAVALAVYPSPASAGPGSNKKGEEGHE
ncbi:ArsR/SmtB family transcription factor [Gorillibacterium timonense]|uniref:ArsR/SmtB family transcription factor n=1 Tax=Gorillibacterium timonense TaxID=1689269 RepID=UPI00071E56B8|nr:helix-turn-helix domain-containing protein [Gorillibacterium timonense]